MSNLSHLKHLNDPNKKPALSKLKLGTNEYHVGRIEYRVPSGVRLSRQGSQRSIFSTNTIEPPQSPFNRKNHPTAETTMTFPVCGDDVEHSTQTEAEGESLPSASVSKTKPAISSSHHVNSPSSSQQAQAQARATRRQSQSAEEEELGIPEAIPEEATSVEPNGGEPSGHGLTAASNNNNNNQLDDDVSRTFASGKFSPGGLFFIHQEDSETE